MFGKGMCLPGTSHLLVVCSVCFSVVVVFLSGTKNIVVYVMISVCLIMAQTLTFSNYHKSKLFRLNSVIKVAKVPEKLKKLKFCFMGKVVFWLTSKYFFTYMSARSHNNAAVLQSLAYIFVTHLTELF